MKKGQTTFGEELGSVRKWRERSLQIYRKPDLTGLISTQNTLIQPARPQLYLPGTIIAWTNHGFLRCEGSLCSNMCDIIPCFSNITSNILSTSHFQGNVFCSNTVCIWTSLFYLWLCLGINFTVALSVTLNPNNCLVLNRLEFVFTCNFNLSKTAERMILTW